MNPEQILANQKARNKAEKLFKKGMAWHTEGYSRPPEYSPEQLGWDAAEAMKQAKIPFLQQARQDFGKA